MIYNISIIKFNIIILQLITNHTLMIIYFNNILINNIIYNFKYNKLNKINCKIILKNN